MYQGFEHRVVDQRPTKRWVVVDDGKPRAKDVEVPEDAEPRDQDAESASRAESDRKEPAASGIISA